MDAALKALIQSNPRYREVLKALLSRPYIERQALQEKIGIPEGDLERLLRPLLEKTMVLELASQADSSVESRVPKRVYLINPDLEQAIRSIAS
jgi:hypothetical protein